MATFLRAKGGRGAPGGLLASAVDFDLLTLPALGAEEVDPHRAVGDRHPAGAGVVVATPQALLAVAHAGAVLAEQDTALDGVYPTLPGLGLRGLRLCLVRRGRASRLGAAEPRGGVGSC